MTLSNAPLRRRLACGLIAWSVLAQAACLTPPADPADYAWEDPDGDKAGGVPAWLEWRDLHFRFRVPGDTYLYKSFLVDVYTDTQTEIQFNATPQKLTIVAPLVIDILGPINEGLRRVEYDFASGTVAVTFSTSDIALDWQAEISASLQAAVASAVEGTRMANRGYSPALDPNIAETLAAVAGGVFDDASSGRRGTGPFDLARAEQIGVRATFFLKQDKTLGEGTGSGLSMCAGNLVEIESDNDFQWPEGSNLQALIDADGMGELATALGIEDLTLRSFRADEDGSPAPYSGFEVISDGEIIAHLQEVRIIGDELELHKWYLAGSALNAAALEKAFLGLFFGKDPETAEARAQTRNGIVRGLVADKLADGLSVALRRLVYKHRRVIPGLDLPTVLEMSPPPALPAP